MGLTAPSMRSRQSCNLPERSHWPMPESPVHAEGAIYFSVFSTQGGQFSIYFPDRAIKKSELNECSIDPLEGWRDRIVQDACLAQSTLVRSLQHIWPLSTTRSDV